jgi:aminopeptidase N
MSRTRWVLFLLALCAGFLSSFARQAIGQPGASPRASASSAETLRTAVDRPIDIKDIRLDLRIDIPKKTVDSKATLKVRSLRPIKSISLDAVDFEVKKVAMSAGTEESKPARYNHDGKKLMIQLDSPWPAGRDGTIHVVYRVREPKQGLHFFAPGKADPEIPLEVWSQGEPISNRYWIPCLDEPDQRQTTELVVTVPRGFDVVSNGKLIERKDNPSAQTVTFDWRQDKPHPSYLVTLVVGQFDVVREEWDGIPVEYYVPKGHKDDVTRSFGRTREMLSYFSKIFGVHYPWDKYAQVVAYQFGGGMENTSATTLGEFALKDERSMLDSTPDWLISHELAHQWWGDLLTCRDWAHLWLNEGFASYSEALWDEHQSGADEYAYNMFGKAGGAIGGGKGRPVVDRRYRTPSSMFDGRAYPKGAWILHMLRQRLGDEAFWRGIQRYGNEHRLQSVETADFRRTMERETGRNLERFFYDWTERAGSPAVEVTSEYLPEVQQARVTVKQTQAGEPFEFPLPIVVYGAGDAEPTTVEMEITGKEHSLSIPLPAAPKFVDVDPNQSVLTELKETKGRDLWKEQLRESPSIVSRIRAVRHFAESKSDPDRELLAQVLTGDKFYGVQVEAARALGKSGGDISREALIRGIQHPHPKVRRACLGNLGGFGRNDAVAAALKEVLLKGDPSYAVESAALSAYAKQGAKDAVAVVSPWLARPSQNDVLRSAALSALGDTKDLSALEALLDWAQPGKPRNSRTAALQALTMLAQNTKPSDAQRQQILKCYLAALEYGGAGVRFSVFTGLSDLGATASSALPILDKLSRDEPNEVIRNTAKRTADAIRAKLPAKPSEEKPRK